MKQKAITREALKEQMDALRLALTAYLEQTMNAEYRSVALKVRVENSSTAMAALRLSRKLNERRERITETIIALQSVENKIKEL